MKKDLVGHIKSKLEEIYKQVESGFYDLKNKDFCQNDLSDKKIAIAVSGGADSMALARIINSINKNAIALILNHNLRLNSDIEAKSVAKQLKDNGLESIILDWKHEPITSGVEEKARIARYEILTEKCKELGIKQLLLAHHMNDQIETFFMNLSRGSGIDGLSGMKEVSIINDILIIRPLLEIKKTEIISFLEDTKTKWFEDETNQDQKMTRNKLRAVLSEVYQSDELIEGRIFQTISILNGVKQMQDKYIDSIFNKIVQQTTQFSAAIQTMEYQKLSRIEQLSLTSKLLRKLSKAHYKGRIKSLDILLNKIKIEKIGSRELMNCKIQWNQEYILFSNLK